MRKIYLEYNMSQRATTATLGIGTTMCMWLEVFGHKSRFKKTMSATMALTSYGANLLMTKIRIRKKEKGAWIVRVRLPLTTLTVCQYHGS